MTTLCITGAAQSDLALVADILRQAGMQAAKPASRGEAVDMAYWHGRVVPERANGEDSPQPIAEVGKLWEQLASDIFLSNMESELWGWADARSTWLLDYWLKFEPGIKVVLVCVSRQQMLANAMANGSDRVSVEAMLHDWNAHHQELLRFHRQNPQRSLLVDAHDCAANPSALIEQCAGRWKLPLEKSAEVSPARGAQDPLALYLAQQLCQEHPHSAGLQTELAGAITRMGGLEVRGKASTLGKWSERLAQVGKPKKALSLYAPQAEEIVADFRLMRDKAARLQRVDEAREELEARNGRLVEDIARQAEKQAETKAWLEAAAKENAVVLQRLREAQEKCDLAIAEHDAALKQAGALQGELATASKARDEQARLAAEGKARIEALTKERDDHAKASAERQAQVEALTKERDSHAKQST